MSSSILSFCEAKTVRLAKMWKPNKKEKKKKAEIEGERAREFWNLKLYLLLNLYFSLFTHEDSGGLVDRSEGRLWVERYDLLLTSFLLLYTLLLFLSFFLSSRFLISVMGRCGNVSQKSTNSVTHRLLIFFLSLFTHEDSEEKKKSWWMCER